MNIISKHRKGKGEGMRWAININKENLDLVKIFLRAGIRIRHVKNMPPMNFGVSDKEMAGTIERMEGGRMSQSFLFSNEPHYIDHFSSLFEEIWKDGTDAKVRIRGIEEGVDSEGIEIIQDPLEIQNLAFILIQTAKEEILVMYSTSNAFHRQERAGKIQLLKDAAKKRAVKVRILTPYDELILETLYRDHFHSLFNEMWKNGIDAKVRIKAIEDGVDSEGIEIIEHPVESTKIM